MYKILKKYWSELLLGSFLLLMILPQTRLPIQVFIQKIIALSPTIKNQDEQYHLSDYNLIYSDHENNTFNLSQHKGEVILINFWATWCPPCIAEMPSFSELHKAYKGKVKFLFISQDEWDKINKFEAKSNYGLPYYKLKSTNATLTAESLPTTYLISKEGKIVISKVGVADWNSESFRNDLDQLIQD